MEPIESKNFGANLTQEEETIGKRVAQKIGGSFETVGQKVGGAIDRVDAATQNVKQSVDQFRQEGWKGLKGLKKRTLDYTRSEPLSALLLAIGAGIFLGWMTRKGR